jgi:Na+/proline symporter
MFLCLLNNLFACANMLLGASAAISALSGIHTIAATFLLPLGVVLYTFVGGIKATFLTDYIHTFIILIILCFFTVKAFTVPEIGSIGGLYELVRDAAIRHPPVDNHAATYLTMTSKPGLMFGILHMCANFGLVIMDTSFFVKAFAASPKAAVPGYVIGGLLYFAIPWCLGTLMSSITLGLENNPIFPTYPRRMNSQEIGNGLVLPYAAMAIAGKGGAAAVLLITFMAVTSTLSAQVIAVSSIISFDMYRTYANKNATDKDVIRWSHYGVIIFGVVAAAFSTLLYYVGVDLGWTLYMLGVVTCPGIFPTVFTILWRKQSKAAVIISPILGMLTGIGVWLGSAHGLYGEVTIATTGMALPCVYGTVASAFSPLPYTLIITLFKPQDFDWALFRNEKLAFKSESLENVLEATHAHRDADGHEQLTWGDDEDVTDVRDPRYLPFVKKWARIAAIWSVATFLGHWVLWPLPMYASKYVFGKGFFVAWMVVAIIWLWLCMLVAGFYPLWDGRKDLLQIWRALTGQKTESKTVTSSETSSNSDAVVTEKGASTKEREADI